MSAKFLIDLEWEGGEFGAPEDRATAAQLRIAFDNQVATQIISDWSQSVSDRVRVSAYPLALWFARSWWRLRWEPFPLTRLPSVSWRMAHEMPAAGHGYLWPHLRFASDGESIEAECRPSPNPSEEPVHYLSRFKAPVDANAFVAQVDAFISLVLNRLDAGPLHGNTELHRVWAEVMAERQDEAVTLWRKLEAQLGYDPDEAPEQAMQKLRALAEIAGDGAVSEIAPVLPRDHFAQSLAENIDAAKGQGIKGRVSTPIYDAVPRASLSVAPWERGRQLARKARHAWALSDELVSDEDLSDVLGIPVKTFQTEDEPSRRKPFGLAIRQDDDGLKILFRRRKRPDVRFEAARYLADHLAAPATDHWLPVTDTKTARQKMQRAFAAEFLCPIDLLNSFLDNDFSDYAIEGAADHFSVTPWMVKSHLANHGILSPDEVNNFNH